MPAQAPDGAPVPPDGALPVSALTRPRGRFGVYIHVPFCSARCGYCDFNTYEIGEAGAGDPEGYLAVALAEVELARRVLPADTPPAATVFLGGGTPTLLAPERLARLIQAVASEFSLAPDAEVSIEANPETLDDRVLAGLLEAGANRISLGMQSGVASVLAVLERRHTPGQAVAMALAARRAGFAHVSLDLIYGAPGESAADWRASLDAALSGQPDHVSAYSLTVEPGTRLAARVRRGETGGVDEDDLADKYLTAEAVLTDAGLANYEISNWAAPGGECRHNLGYWSGGEWWGVGPGAHSHFGGVRWWNLRHPIAYRAALADGRSPGEGREVLTDEQRRAESVMLSIRRSSGLDLGELDARALARARDVVARGLAVERDDRLVLTLAGRLLADAIVLDLIR